VVGQSAQTLLLLELAVAAQQHSLDITSLGSFIRKTTRSIPDATLQIRQLDTERAKVSR
jgi:hypothetical protein